MTDPYKELAIYLDSLPAGFPPTKDGLELQILQKLFTTEEAELALHLSQMYEEPQQIASRAAQPVAEVADILAEMEKKGLIASRHRESQPTTYAISQFVIGIWEDQVDRLDEEMATLFEAYVATWWDQGPWKKVPQMRTIPVMQTIPITSEVMPYEQAEAILRSKTNFAVRNCICRQERELIGKGCGKPMEVCLSFDSAALNTVATGKGRMISLDEALAIIEQAKESGLVLQPANSKDPIFLCSCCSCCCGVLRNLKSELNPGSLVANPFVAVYEDALCSSCGACVDICPMAALTLDDEGLVNFQQVRCIGCGLCVTLCPNQAMHMVLRPVEQQPTIPRNTLGTFVSIAKARIDETSSG